MKKTRKTIVPIGRVDAQHAKLLMEGRLRLAALGVSALLVVGAVTVFLARPEQGPQVWAMIGPVIACVVTTSLHPRRDWHPNSGDNIR